ncbi:CRISPR system Cascade subunit CasA [Pantoea sp. Nvir]|uniref:type I-E CRISPR-associated protein Cse1/CasA n=1 Tax=Pantoea sp. Nvir TaxID=2576760 RepID=UPI0030CB2EAB
MDLITEPWLPVITRSGVKKKIALCDILADDILDVAYPRADFQGAAWQFLIGILQCCVAPEEEDGWSEVWQNGVETTLWQQRLQTISPAMQFGAQKPAFLQSYESLDAEICSIAGLLIDAPGGNTLKLNKDHFVKRHSTSQICPDCAVMALFTVQTNSPAGGAGYRVSLRGGGPLTTLIVPLAESQYSLWQKLWLNVLPQETLPQPAEYARIFPWLAPTLTSEKAGNKVTPDNAHLLQAYWGMPRRIELDFNETRAGICDLCGEHHEALLISMRSKNYGVQYDNWVHPLSPYRQSLKESGAPLLAIKGQPGGLSYKDWLGLTLTCEDKFNRTLPARVTHNITRYRRLPPTGLWCFAWDMDNAKARCWYQHRVPLILSVDNKKLGDVIQSVVLFAVAALQVLKGQLKSAWFSTPKEAKVDFSMVDIAFWQETEASFRILLDALIPDPERLQPATRQALKCWETELHLYLLNIFDREIFADPEAPDDILLRQITARRHFEKEYYKLKSRKALLELATDRKESENAK